MGDKKFPLSIVLQTVDNATAGIQRVQARIDKLAVNQIGAKLAGKGGLGEALGKLGESAGVGKVLGGFARVGGALKDLAGKFVFLGVAAAGASIAAVGALKGIVDQFDNLGDTADKIGITAQQLAELHFAAEVAGASVEDLDAGMLAFSKNLGQLKANKGRLASFLDAVSPALKTQLSKSKGPVEALDLFSNAMAKLPDSTKKTALAAAGGLGANLVPMLGSGAKGIDAMRKRFVGLAGDIGKAAEISGEIDNDFHDLGAAALGAKGKIIEGVGPAISKLLDQLTKFIAENQVKIGEWAKQVGDALPGAVDKAGKALDRVFDIIGKVSDSIGGLTTAGTILAGLFAGKLIVSIGAVSVALLTTPFGWVIASLAAITAGTVILIAKWDEWGKSIEDIADKVNDVFDFFTPKEVLAKTKEAQGRNVGSLLEAQVRGLNPGDALSPFNRTSAPLSAGRLKIDVNFANAPRGTRVEASPSTTIDVDTDVGYQMGP